MARSVKEIEASLQAEKDSGKYLSLELLDTTSKSSVLGAMMRVVAFSVAVFEQIQDVFKSEQQAEIERSQVFTNAWYVDKILSFQYGDPLLFDSVTKRPFYEVIDDAKKIIDRVAVTGRGQVIIKVAKGSGALSQEELNGAEAYLSKIQCSGAQIGMISLPSDKLKIHADLRLDASYGESVVLENVELAITEFISKLEFNGVLRVNDIERVTREVPGVIDLFIKTSEARSDSGNFSAIENGFYYPTSGYMELEDLQINPIANA